MSGSAPGQVALSAVMDYTVKRAGVFALHVALPAGYTLESAQGDNILQWQPRDTAAGAGQVLDVSFKNRLLGAYSLRLELLRLHRDLPPTVAIPGVQPLDAQKLSGFISVAAEPGVAVKTTNFDGLTEIPGASLASGANAAAGVLAYKFLSAQPGPLPDWKLDVACEKVDSWVRAQIAQIISVSDTLLNGQAIVRYDIQNAPVKEFRFLIPAAYTNIEFNCPNLRRRDQNPPTANGASNCKTRCMASSRSASPGKSRWTSRPTRWTSPASRPSASSANPASSSSAASRPCRSPKNPAAAG